MAKTPSTHPILALLRACENDKERQAFAKAATTTVNYLYALAGSHRLQPRLDKALAIEAASIDWHVRTNGRIPLISIQDLAKKA